jgi:hypothetical protein
LIFSVLLEEALAEEMMLGRGAQVVVVLVVTVIHLEVRLLVEVGLLKLP